MACNNDEIPMTRNDKASLTARHHTVIRSASLAMSGLVLTMWWYFPCESDATGIT